MANLPPSDSGPDSTAILAIVNSALAVVLDAYRGSASLQAGIERTPHMTFEGFTSRGETSAKLVKMTRPNIRHFLRWAHPSPRAGSRVGKVAHYLHLTGGKRRGMKAGGKKSQTKVNVKKLTSH